MSAIIIYNAGTGAGHLQLVTTHLQASTHLPEHRIPRQLLTHPATIQPTLQSIPQITTPDERTSVTTGYTAETLAET